MGVLTVVVIKLWKLEYHDTKRLSLGNKLRIYSRASEMPSAVAIAHQF